MHKIDRFLSLDICHEKVKMAAMDTGLYPLPEIVVTMNRASMLFLLCSFIVITSVVEQWLFLTAMTVFIVSMAMYLFSLVIKQYLTAKRIHYLNERRIAVGREKLSLFTF